MRALTAGLFVAMFLLVSHLQGSAQAYLDPGTGSLVLQVVLAGFVGALALGRHYWSQVKAFVLRRDATRDTPLGD